jgi:hypothetical protein
VKEDLPLRITDEATAISPYKKTAAGFAENSAGLQNQNRLAVLVRAREIEAEFRRLTGGKPSELERKAGPEKSSPTRAYSGPHTVLSDQKRHAQYFACLFWCGPRRKRGCAQILEKNLRKVKLLVNRTKQKASGRYMFRLAESENTILVHEKVKNYLTAKGFKGLEFYAPEEVAA